MIAATITSAAIAGGFAWAVARRLRRWWWVALALIVAVVAGWATGWAVGWATLPSDAFDAGSKDAALRVVGQTFWVSAAAAIAGVLVGLRSR